MTRRPTSPAMSRLDTQAAGRWSPARACAPVVLAGLAALAPPASGPTAAKDSWYEIPSQRGGSAGRQGEAVGGVARETFDDPPRAYRPMFGAEAERHLQAAIRRYEAIVANGGWPKIPEGGGLGPGSMDERVRLLRQRLLVTGDLPYSSRRGYKYKKPMVAAVKRFQLRHGLKPTGRVYASALRALNVPAERRLAQLRLNLDRIRKIAPQLKGRRYVIVNIPAYELQAVADGRVRLYSRVITGKPGTPTPILTASVRALNFHPYWNVPQSIVRRALLPKLAKDPDYLAREHIRVFSGAGPGSEVAPDRINRSKGRAGGYRFRQDPGPHNALGVIRFDMPNKHIVYMHDTPLQRLFRYGVRAYSAGCVRVQKPFLLAEWLLEGNGGWSRRRIRGVVASGRGETVDLAAPVPVHLIYVTAWGAPDGTAQFRLDAYNRDGVGRMIATLEGPQDQITALTP